MSFKDKLKELRTDLGYLQKEMAEKLGVKPTTYTNWENGRETDYDNLMMIAEYFKISVDELIGYAKPEKEEAVKFDRAKNVITAAGYKISDVSGERNKLKISTTDRPPKEIIVPRDKFIEFIGEIITDCNNRHEEALAANVKALVKASELVFLEADSKVDNKVDNR